MTLQEVAHVLEASDQLHLPVIVVYQGTFYLVDEHTWTCGPQIAPEAFLAMRNQGLIPDRPDEDLSIDGNPTYPIKLRPMRFFV